MKTIHLRALLLLAAASAPLHARQSGPNLPGATLPFPWTGPAADFHELHALRFSSLLEADVMALHGDRAVLVHHPGRFELTYELATGVTAIAACPLDGGTDAVLYSDALGLHRARRNPSPGPVCETTTLAAGAWASAAGLWTYVEGGAVRVCAYDAPGDQLLRGRLDGAALTPLAPVPLPGELRDVAALDWSDQHPGKELALLFENDLFVATVGGSALDWYPVTPGDSMGVLRSSSGADVLAWVSTWFGPAFLYARNEATVYTPFWVGPSPFTDLVVLDRDGDGADDVALTSAVEASVRVLRNDVATATFGPFPDGDRFVLTNTAGEQAQGDPAVVGAAADLDNDGSADLFLGQTGSRASQVVLRPEWEERYRAALQDDEDLVVATAGATHTATVALLEPYHRPCSEYHVQAFALDGTTGLLDSVPLDDRFVPITAAPQLVASYPAARLPSVYALFLGIAQVERTGAQVTARYPTRWIYWSPFPALEAALEQLPYPPYEDPEDPGITTGTRVTGRTGGEGSSGGPPP